MSLNISQKINYTMKNRYWILTYDVANEIEQLYKKHEHTKYYLNCSLATASEGEELCFFLRKLKWDQYRNTLKLFEYINNFFSDSRCYLTFNKFD